MFETVKYISSGRFISRGQWIHPRRTISSNEIIFVLEGTVNINEDGKEYSLVKNDVLLLEAGLEHFGFEHSENTSFYWMHWVDGPDIPHNCKCRHIESPYNLSLLFRQLLHSSALDDGFKESCDYLSRLILIEMYRTNDSSDAGTLANNIANWITANSDLPLKATDVAGQFGYNTDYLSRLFKARFGKSLKEYIDESKMKFIKNQLLTTGASLSEIAEIAGFSDYKYFLKFFKYHEGLTPTEFCNIYSRTHINNK